MYLSLTVELNNSCLRLNKDSGINLLSKLLVLDALSLIGHTGFQLLDLCCSSVGLAVEYSSCFISVLDHDLANLLYYVLIVCVPFPFGVWGGMWNSILSVPDQCLSMYLGVIIIFRKSP